MDGNDINKQTTTKQKLQTEFHLCDLIYASERSAEVATVKRKIQLYEGQYNLQLTKIFLSVF